MALKDCNLSTIEIMNGPKGVGVGLLDSLAITRNSAANEPSSEMPGNDVDLANPSKVVST